jgi:hypothetical protein
MDRVLVENLTVAQRVKKLRAFYGRRRFITVFTTPDTGAYPEPDESSPRLPSHFFKTHSNMFLPSTSSSSMRLFPVTFRSAQQTVCGRRGPLPESRIPGCLARPMHSVPGRRQYCSAQGTCNTRKYSPSDGNCNTGTGPAGRSHAPIHFQAPCSDRRNPTLPPLRKGVCSCNANPFCP